MEGPKTAVRWTPHWTSLGQNSKSAPQGGELRAQYGQVMRYGWDSGQKASAGRAVPLAFG